ncbi:hypothetical protein HOC01_01360 [archaeon]|jgi:hypothetical protein|nr:hypothetical protein [archaeon]MBT6698032.1 hypothetical protein [archaeon]
MALTKLLITFFNKHLLRDFFKVDLSGIERSIAVDSVKQKYAKGTGSAILSGIFLIPAILFLDTTVLVSVLIPITMVAGTAWFAISLANVRKKFEDFGLELTTDMFEAFAASLIMLAMLTFFSLLPLPKNHLITIAQTNQLIPILAAVLGICVVFRLLYKVFQGSVKYDINDAMLTGQNESAERFFKKSLSLLHTSADNLRSGKGLEVANYYLGLSFYEIYAFIQETGILNGKLKGLMNKALLLKQNPTMEQLQADEISIDLIENFVFYSKNIEGQKSNKCFDHIKDELHCIKSNKDEPQEIVDARLSTIFSEIAELLELQGESLFKAN